MLSWCKKNTWKLTKKSSTFMVPEKKKKNIFSSYINSIYSHSLFSFAHRLTQRHRSVLECTEVEERLSVVLLLLSFLCIEQSLVQIGYFTSESRANALSMTKQKWSSCDKMTRLSTFSLKLFFFLACFNEKNRLQSHRRNTHNLSLVCPVEEMSELSLYKSKRVLYKSKRGFAPLFSSKT